MMWRWLAVVVITVMTLVAAFTAGYAVGDWQPECPTEDSCRAVYVDGRWEIQRIIP